MSYAEAIVRHALEFANEKGAKKVNLIKILVGELLMINPEQLEFCFEVASKGTILEGAKLEIEFVKAKATCTLCGRKFEGVEYPICECGGFLQIEGGKEFILEKIQMEV